MDWQRFRHMIYGEEEHYGFRGVVFHQVCFLSLVALTAGLFLTIRLGQWDLTLIMVGCQIALTFSYWLSRVMNRYVLGFSLFVTVAYSLLASNYFLVGGINGTTDIISLLVLGVFFASSQSRSHWIWTALHGLVFCGLTYWDYSTDKSGITPYTDEFQRYMDTGLTYIFVLIFMFYIFRLIRRAFEHEKGKVEVQRLKLEASKAELEQSNQELIKVLSIIAHDVRNPLASIQSFLEVSADGSLAPDDQKAINQGLQEMVQNTSHMLDDMVNWSKVQISGQATNFHKQGIGSWLNKTADHMRQMAKAKGVLFNDNYNGRLKLYCDPILMTVIIRNLIQNAVKFTSPGNVVQLEVKQDKSHMLFEVIDEGLGIPEADLEKLFTDKSISKSGTRQERGSGFGLLIVKEYVDLHQGKIEVESTVGKGSRFTVKIPLAQGRFLKS